jgi:photosystem II stability/assembly factor-like uncharacterized protein
VRIILLVLALSLSPVLSLPAQPAGQDTLSSSTFSGLRLRSLGPAVTSGRIAALAVHPTDRATWYVAVASGGVWKTTNAGTTWSPLFDGEGSYSIGAITLDPQNPDTVWVGTGENNSQRSAGYGDGVYRSDDGGKSWKNTGLFKSEHIGKIVVDPRNSDVVFVAAQGPLWAPGGDRGLYKTTDGGKFWKRILDISENTGVTDLVLDPRNPDVLIAAAYQRRRHVWTLINGGPESALYKSTDGGAHWKKLSSGLPRTDLGRIGLAAAPSDPDRVYAIIESIDGNGGIFRSSDRGETWEKRNGFDQQAQYYAHLVVDPKDKDRIYVMNVLIQVSNDGGRTLRTLGERWKHVDNHCIWIDPKNTNYYLVGCDGGLYESFDRARSWKFVSNLPVTQFYDITVDDNGPFYHVYGGTQDNFTLGGPAKTTSVHGITNSDWFVVQGGDGFHCRVDPKDPNIVYAESQYAGLVRFDRRTGQKIDIQPQPGKGEPPLRWNWDSPLLICPHDHTRLYFAANRVFRSDDRGNSWKPISGDLTRQLDRDKLAVMGKVWGPDTVAKHLSTSYYGNIVALAKSPRQEGLLYAGTDDGLLQVTEDGGKSWRKIDKFPGVPERTYVSRVLASQHDAQTLYAAFDNHKMGDFAPYLLRSSDAGRTWKDVKGDLPERGSVLALAEDHKDPNLLFAGTEFGLFFSADGGKKWLRLRAGLPTIAVRDLAIQKQENDLVVGTFGRGIYVLDDYTPLRGIKAETLKNACSLFPVREALQYIPTRQYGGGGKAFLGAAFFTADNPPFGATFTYHLKESIKTKKQKRRDVERAARRKGLTLPYPTPAQLRAEVEEEAPVLLLSIHGEDGKVLRTITGPATEGIHRVNWDLRLPSPTLPRPRRVGDEEDEELFTAPSSGPLALPGTYTVSLARRVEGVTTSFGVSQSFKIVAWGPDAKNGDSVAERKALLEFEQKVGRLDKAVSAALGVASETASRLEQIKRALDHAASAEEKWRQTARSLEKQNRDILRALRGDTVLRGRNENTPLSIQERVRYALGAARQALSGPTQTQRESYRIAVEEFAEQLPRLRKLVEVDLKELDKTLDEAGIPWTPGRLPEWKEK